MNFERMRAQGRRMALTSILGLGMMSWQGCTTPDGQPMGSPSDRVVRGSLLSLATGNPLFLLDTEEPAPQTQVNVVQNASSSYTPPSSAQIFSNSPSSSDPFLRIEQQPDVGIVKTIFCNSVSPNASYPVGYDGLRSASSPRFPRDQKIYVEFRTEQKPFQQMFIKVIDQQGTLIYDIPADWKSPGYGVCVPLQERSLSTGTYDIVVHGREHVPPSVAYVTIPRNKPIINLGALFGNKPAPQYTPPPAPEPRILFIGRARFEVY